MYIYIALCYFISLTSHFPISLNLHYVPLFCLISRERERERGLGYGRASYFGRCVSYFTGLIGRFFNRHWGNLKTWIGIVLNLFGLYKKWIMLKMYRVATGFVQENADQNASIDVQQHHTRSHVCSSVWSVVPNVFVYQMELMATSNLALAITTGRPSKVAPSALNYVLNYFSSTCNLYLLIIFQEPNFIQLYLYIYTTLHYVSSNVFTTPSLYIMYSLVSLTSSRLQIYYFFLFVLPLWNILHFYNFCPKISSI